MPKILIPNNINITIHVFYSTHYAYSTSPTPKNFFSPFLRSVTIFLSQSNFCVAVYILVLVILLCSHIFGNAFLPLISYLFYIYIKYLCGSKGK